MFDWTQHVYTNKLAQIWVSRSLTTQEQSILYYKMLLNYYGFWVSKFIHVYPFYILYKRGFFKISSERRFWTTMVALMGIMAISSTMIDRLLNLTLVFEIEELSGKYESQIDVYRKEYLMNKREKDMVRAMKLQQALEEGKLVRMVIDKN